MRLLVKIQSNFYLTSRSPNVMANALSCLELESNTSLDSRADAAEIFAITSEDITSTAYILNLGTL